MTRPAPAPSRPKAVPATPRPRRRGRRPAVAAAWLAAALIAAGCAQTAPVQSSTAPSAASETASQGKAAPIQFPDLPIPQGAKLNVDKTLVVGSRTWYGQLSLDTGDNANTVFEFYSRELENFGWRRIASLRAPTSILTYDRDDRVLAIAITPSRVYGSEVTITVSPREGTMPGSAGGAAVGPGVGSPMGRQMGGAGGGRPLMPPPVRQVR